jgi:hypothetical protein
MSNPALASDRGMRAAPSQRVVVATISSGVFNVLVLDHGRLTPASGPDPC